MKRATRCRLGSISTPKHAGSSRWCCSRAASGGARGGGRQGSLRAVCTRLCWADATGRALPCSGGSQADGTVAQGAVRSVRLEQAGSLSRRPDQGGDTQLVPGRRAAPLVAPRRPLPSDCVDLMRVAAPSVRVAVAGLSVRLKARWRRGARKSKRPISGTRPGDLQLLRSPL